MTNRYQNYLAIELLRGTGRAVLWLQGNMAAAAAALANSLGAASCGMGSPGVSQSNPLLGQYAALLGLARSPSGGPGTLACPLPCFTLVSMLNVAHSLMGQYAKI
jgi:hypothetical protein